MEDAELIKIVSNMDSYILEDDIRLYNKYVSRMMPGTTVLDVGTGLGKSAIGLSLANPEVQVLTVDDGSAAFERGWAADQKGYEEKMKALFDSFGVKNCTFYFGDIFEMAFKNRIPYLDLFHLDDEALEADILEAMIPIIKINGIILMRNYNRCKDRVDQICRGYKFLENMGLIQVIQKI